MISNGCGIALLRKRIARRKPVHVEHKFRRGKQYKVFTTKSSPFGFPTLSIGQKKKYSKIERVLINDYYELVTFRCTRLKGLL